MDALQKTRSAIIDVLAMTGSIDGHFARRLALYLRELDEGRATADVAMGAAMALYRETHREWVTAYIGTPFSNTPRSDGEASRRASYVARFEVLAALAGEDSKHVHDLNGARSLLKLCDPFSPTPGETR